MTRPKNGVFVTAVAVVALIMSFGPAAGVAGATSARSTTSARPAPAATSGKACHRHLTPYRGRFSKGYVIVNSGALDNPAASESLRIGDPSGWHRRLGRGSHSFQEARANGQQLLALDHHAVAVCTSTILAHRTTPSPSTPCVPSAEEVRHRVRVGGEPERGSTRSFGRPVRPRPLCSVAVPIREVHRHFSYTINSTYPPVNDEWDSQMNTPGQQRTRSRTTRFAARNPSINVIKIGSTTDNPPGQDSPAIATCASDKTSILSAGVFSNAPEADTDVSVNGSSLTVVPWSTRPTLRPAIHDQRLCRLRYIVDPYGIGSAPPGQSEDESCPSM